MGEWNQNDLSWSGLRIELRSIDPDGTVGLKSVVRSEGYQGEGFAWCEAGGLEKLANDIEQFDSQHIPVAEMQAGYFSRESGSIIDLRFGLKFFRFTKAGKCAARVEIAKEVLKSRNRTEPHRLIAILQVESPSITRFASQIRHMLKSEHGEAALDCFE